MAEPGVRQRLAAILAADVAGYTRLMADDEAATIAALRDRRDLFRRHIETNDGRVVDMAGDSVLAVFASVAGAVTAAIEAQRGLAERDAGIAAERRMRFRIGINLGDIREAEDGTVYGDGVNVAARLESLAEPGGVAISEDGYRQVRDRLGLAWRDGGEQSVKNVARPIRVWRWSVEETADATVAVAAADPAPDLPDRPSIAVLPFDNMSGDPEQDYFADGITEDIITDLSKVSGLFVIARNSSFAYKGRDPDIRVVCRELGVRYVLEGSVRKAGNRVRINAQLIEGARGGHLWAERYDRGLEDIFAVQDDVTREIVGALKVALTAGERSRREGRPKVDPEAYDCFARGRALLYRYRPEIMAEGRALLERAAALDPGFAPAHATIALFHIVDYTNGWNGADAARLAVALQLAQKAVAVDENEPLAYHALALVQIWRRELEDGRRAAERAIALDPNFAGAYTALAAAEHFLGHSERAIELLQIALRLDPQYDAALQFLGRAQLSLRRYDEAEATFMRRLARSPRSDIGRVYLASVYGHTGRREEARRMWAEAMEINPDYSVARLREVLPYRDPAWFEHFADGLRQAGLPA